MTRKKRIGKESPIFKINENIVTSFDGTKIYYNSTGTGFPIICTSGIACDMYAWKYIVERFSHKCRVVRWNYRGHGKSEKPSDLKNLTIENCADDLAKVMDHAKISDAVLLGHSMGVQVLLEFYKRNKKKVKALVFIAGSYGNLLDTFHDSNYLSQLFPLLFKFITSNHEEFFPYWKKIIPTHLAYKIASLLEINGNLIKKDDFMPFLDHLSELDLNLFMRMLKCANDHSAKEVLHTINVPVLIFGSENDMFTPVWLSREMHRMIPGSEFQFLPLGTHTATIEHPDLIELRLERFLMKYFPREYCKYNF